MKCFGGKYGITMHNKQQKHQSFSTVKLFLLMHAF